MSLEDNERCGTCKFYMPAPKVCRRFPPVPMMVGIERAIMAGMQDKPAITPFFPNMMPNGWCGEYKSLPQIEEQPNV